MNISDSHPLVSIIIVNYNYEDFVEHAIDSALQQSYSNLEVIVVDDGSTDDSWAVISHYKNRIHCVQKENAGQASAMNVGFSKCKGEWILFLDADDELLPDAIPRCIESLTVNQKISKIHAPLQVVDGAGNVSKQKVPRQLLAHGDLQPLLLQHGPESYVCPPTTGNLWNRQFLQKVFPIPEEIYRVSADAYLFTLSPLFGKTLRLDSPIGLYRVHGRNLYWQSAPKLTHLRTDICRYQQRVITLRKFATDLGLKVSDRTWKLNNRYYLAKLLLLCKFQKRRLTIKFLGTCIQASLTESIVYWKRLSWVLWFLSLWMAPFGLASVIARPFGQLRTRL